MATPLPSVFRLSLDLLLWAIVIHVTADWLFQTEWMAVNKRDLRHPAAWVHSGLHTLGLLIVFPWFVALIVGVSHLLIDTRKPITWWMTVIKRMPQSAPGYLHVELWLDQIFHVGVLLIAVMILT